MTQHWYIFGNDGKFENITGMKSKSKQIKKFPCLLLQVMHKYLLLISYSCLYYVYYRLGNDQLVRVFKGGSVKMDSKEFIDCDEKLGDFGQFIVVEETVITQRERWTKRFYLRSSNNILFIFSVQKIQQILSLRGGKWNKNWENQELVLTKNTIIDMTKTKRTDHPWIKA